MLQQRGRWRHARHGTCTFKLTFRDFKWDGRVTKTCRRDCEMQLRRLSDGSWFSFCWDISVTCPVMVLKLVVLQQYSLDYIFRHRDRNWLNFFSVISKQIQSVTEKNQPTAEEHVGVNRAAALLVFRPIPLGSRSNYAREAPRVHHWNITRFSVHLHCRKPESPLWGSLSGWPRPSKEGASLTTTCCRTFSYNSTRVEDRKKYPRQSSGKNVGFSERSVA